MRPITKKELSELERIHNELRKTAIVVTRLESELGAILQHHHVRLNHLEASPKLWAEVGALKDASERLRYLDSH